MSIITNDNRLEYNTKYGSYEVLKHLTLEGIKTMEDNIKLEKLLDELHKEVFSNFICAQFTISRLVQNYREYSNSGNFISQDNRYLKIKQLIIILIYCHNIEDKALELAHSINDLIEKILIQEVKLENERV